MANTGFALGGLGLTSILAEEKKLNFSGKSTIVPKLDPKQPYLARSQHFSAKAKKVLMPFFLQLLPNHQWRYLHCTSVRLHQQGHRW